MFDKLKVSRSSLRKLEEGVSDCQQPLLTAKLAYSLIRAGRQRGRVQELPGGTEGYGIRCVCKCHGLETDDRALQVRRISSRPDQDDDRDGD